MSTTIPTEAAEGMNLIECFAYVIDGQRYSLAEDAAGDLFIYAPNAFGFWQPAARGELIDL